MSSAIRTHSEPSDGSGVSPDSNGGTCELCPDLPHPKYTHCVHCHASWTRASKTAHCMSCHRTFSSPSAFDRHLLPVGCTAPEGVVIRRTGKAVFRSEPTPNVAGTPVWHMAGERPKPNV